MGLLIPGLIIWHTMELYVLYIQFRTEYGRVVIVLLFSASHIAIPEAILLQPDSC